MAPAFSAECEIEVYPGGMKGKADGASLGKVLAEVTLKAGYPIFIDEQIQDVPVTFSIQDRLSPEKFIKRIVRPHSYAIVFGSEGEDKLATIHEVWVFRKGQQFSTTYVDLKASVERSGGASPSGPTGPSGAKIPGSGPSVDPKKIFKKPLVIKKNPYGGASFGYRDPNKGPDYRMTPYERQEAYFRYQTQKKMYERRMASEMLTRAHKEFKDSRDGYWTRRNQEIRQQIEDLKKWNKKEEEE
jgi:hypothetical protein